MGIAARLNRASVLAAIFGTYVACVMVLAWIFATKLTAAWFDALMSRWVYTFYLIASAIFLAGVGVLAVGIQNAFDGRVREINRELGGLLLNGNGTGVSREVALHPSLDDPDSTDSDSTDSKSLNMSVILETLGEFQNQDVLMMPRKAAGAAALSLHRLQIMLLDRRERLQRRRQKLVGFLSGPVAMATAFLGLSAALLPAGDGMLQAFYQLNAALILGLAYSWVGLAAYFAASVFGIVATLRKDPGPKDRLVGYST